MKSILSYLLNPSANYQLPSFYEEPELKSEPRKAKLLPAAAKMVSWGAKENGRRLAIVTNGRNFIEWKLCDIDEAKELQTNIKPDLDIFDYAIIEEYGLNGEAYQRCKLDVLNGITYKVIGDRHDKSVSWVKSVGKYIKQAHNNRLDGAS